MEVSVPPGLGPGAELRIEVDGRDYLVTVPDGCSDGSFVVALPSEEEAVTIEEERVEVTVPDGVGAGDEVVVQLHHGDFVVEVPEGSGPGQAMWVTVPKPCPKPNVGPQDDQEQQQERRQVEQERQQAEQERQQPEREGPQVLQAGQEKESPAGQPRAYDAASDDEERPPNELSGSSSETESSSSTEADGCKFAVGMPVEVMRTDGLWTLCTVVEYDAAGGTYTVQLADGRRKDFVEPDWLRLPAFLFQSSAII